jgi:beta-glucuronidase
MKTLLLICWCGIPAVSLAQTPEIPASLLPAARMEWDDGQDPMRSRLFRTTSTRTQLDLGGWWDFVADPSGAGEKQGFPARFPAPETTLWVPGTWNSTARYWNYVGPGWYRRKFEVPADGNLRLHFGSVFYLAKVWLDGRLLGEHEGGYVPFDFAVKNLKKGSHSLVVLADNRLSERTLPKRNVDWFPYGGIERPVYAESVPAAYIERFHVIPPAVADSKTVLKVRVFVRNLGNEVTEKVAFSVNGRELISSAHRMGPGASVLELEAPLSEPRTWSPASPWLYSARVALGTGADDQFTRFGVRTVSTRGSGILLNGVRLRLAGANRHEDHADWGSAVPPQLIRQDIEIIKRLGANAVRAHYALPELFMDYCDQYGLVFLAEAPAWQYSTGQLQDPGMQDKMLNHLAAMVARDRNHPSILTWSLGNEWPNPDKSYDAIRGMVERARKLDATRLITFVTGGPHAWKVHQLIDVICVNWARYQWYDPFTTLDREEGEKSVSDLARIHAASPDKPVILTEMGGAESQAGWHNWGNVKWSEEFQARNVEDSARHALEEDWISGGCVWQFADARSAPERFLAGRMHGWNGKGIVDAYRNPKLAFYRLQQVYRTAFPAAGAKPGRVSE